MKKRNIGFIVFASALVALSACESKERSVASGSSSDTSLELNERLYERALEMGDIQTQIVALNYILLQDTNNWAYKDSLARIYIKGGMLDAGIALGEEVYQHDKKNYGLLQLVAQGHKYNGDLATAYKYFHTLYKEENNVKYTLYLAEIAFQQGNIQVGYDRLDEALADSTGTKVETQKASGAGVQMVDVRAVAYQLLAQIEAAKGDLNATKQNLQKALQIAPDFEEAYYSLQQLSGAEKQQALSMRQQQEMQKARKAQQDQQQYENWLKQQQGK